MSRLARGVTQFRIEWLSGILSWGVKRLGVMFNTVLHLGPSLRMSASITSTYPVCFHGMNTMTLPTHLKLPLPFMMFIYIITNYCSFYLNNSKESWCILCSWDRASQFYVNKCPTRCNYTQFILSVNCSACFGWFLHPSSGAQITVSTASGTSQPLLLPVATVEELRLRSQLLHVSSNGWLVPDAVDTVICAPVDGWWDSVSTPPRYRQVAAMVD
jgi:hypothetical protein